MRLLLTVLITAIIISSPCLAGGYKTTKVIEVGPATHIPFRGPLKWSRDGTKLAYFAHNQLMISDTLGNKQEVARIDQEPRRFEWISDQEVAIMLVDRQSGGPSNYALTVFDINTGQSRIVDQFVRGRRINVGDTYIDGPFQSLEGDAYYVHKVFTDGFREVPLGRRRKSIDETRLFSDGNKAENHILRWTGEGLYNVNLAGTDSTRLCDQPYPDMRLPTDMSFDGSHIVNGGLIIRLTDHVNIVLDTIHLDERPSRGGCGFNPITFNPAGTELVFHIECDDGHEVLAEMIGTFDYSTFEFEILDKSLGLTNCTAPTYAPDGLKIALLGEGVLYIVYREEL